MSEIAKALCELAAGGRTSGALELHGRLADALAQTSGVLEGRTSRTGI
jgi:hypothetical protein